MNSCENIKEMLVLHSERALDPENNRRVDEHLAGCVSCRAESEQIARLRGWLADPELFEPVQDMTWQLLPEQLAQRARTLPATRRWVLPRLGLPRWAWSAAAVMVLVLGIVATLRFRAPGPPPAQTVQGATGNDAFISRMRSAYAREATSDYLVGCQSLLLDLTSAEKKCTAGRYDVALEVARARQLLQQKRMLDAELNVSDVARARNLCDDLECFLVNLSTAQTCETRDALRIMERFIEKQQLLLRINIIQAGIS